MKPGLCSDRLQRFAIFALCLGVAAAISASTWAHEIDEGEPGAFNPHNWSEAWSTWDVEPGSVVGLAAWALIYAVGARGAWRSAGAGHGVKWFEVWCFATGWGMLAFALLSPLHPLGETLFSAHMVQHEIVMLVAAPLIVLGRPIIPFLRALPSTASHRLGRLSNRPAVKRAWDTVSHPITAWLIHAAVLWGWHAPAAFQATLHSEWAHAAQHLSFLSASMLFWWTTLHGHRGTGARDGAGVASLFTTAVHSGLLGALLTVSSTPWYPDYSHTQQWGLTPLEDQQLGGLVMWVPACTVYIVAGLYLFARWLNQSKENDREGRLPLRSTDAIVTLDAAPASVTSLRSIAERGRS